MPFRRIVCTLVLVVVACLCIGCGSLGRNHGEALEEDEATWAARLHPRSERKESFFFNEKSRQIEDSLGF
jgi:hypothetical protein